MELTDVERERLENLVLHFVKKKNHLSGGHNGLSVLELIKIVELQAENLVSKGVIKKKETKDSYVYFI